MQGIFLDRDGVINKERADYVKSWDEFVFLPGVFSALGHLAQLNLPIFIITNQSVIGRKIVSHNDIDAIHNKMLHSVAKTGLDIREIFVCPHHPDAGCRCRKPAPGMLQDAAEKHNLNLAECVFIGDSITDYQAAQSCGCPMILLRSGRQGDRIDSLLESNQVDWSGRATLTVPIFDDLPAATEYLVYLHKGRPQDDLWQ